jgi:dTDP-glucose pyrophosphorylase
MKGRLESVLLAEDATIKQALQIIQQGSIRAAVVADGDLRLLGTVTDGDVRRAILRGVSLESKVSNVMNTSPYFAPAGLSRENLIREMRERDILFIPIIDNGKLISISTLNKELNARQLRENPVFIMAGGFGTRLRPLTDHCPKPMLKVGDKPMLETLIINFKSYGFRRFFISLHYMPEVIRDYFGDGQRFGVNIEYVYEKEPLGTGGALALLPDLDEQHDLLMINGDVLTNVNYSNVLTFHETKNADVTVCVRDYDFQIPYGVVKSDGEDHGVTKIEEKPIQRFFINAGIYVISTKIVNGISKESKLDMPDLISTKLQQDKRVMMFPIHEYWMDIGQLEDFARAQTDIQLLGLS